MSDISECLFEALKPYEAYLVAGIAILTALMVASFFKEKDSKRPVIFRMLLPAHTVFAWAFWVGWVVFIPGCLALSLYLGSDSCGIKL